MRFKRILAGALGAVCMASGIFLGLGMSRYYVHQETRAYVEKNIETVMKDQEKKLGIKHDGKPHVVYPNEFSGQIDCRNECGAYDPDKDTILLNQSYFFLCVIVSDESWNKKLAKMLGAVDVRAVLHHELGHFYLDKLLERKKKPQLRTKQTQGQKIINEGVATYFGARMGGYTEALEKYARENRNRKLVGTLDEMAVYVGGATIVKPIFEEFGEQGILYLADHPPKDQDNLEDYLHKTVNELRNSSSS